MKFGRDPSDIFAISIEALSRYKFRTGLSVLGIVLGIAAVISMMSVSKGAQIEVLRQVEMLGLDNIVVRPRNFTPGPAASSRSEGLTTGDAEKLLQIVPLVSLAMPLVERYSKISMPHWAPMVPVLGVTEQYRDILRLGLGRGRFLVPLDVRTSAHVCVLGGVLSRNLFGYRDPVGQAVRVDADWYTVTGVLEDRISDERSNSALAGRDLNQAVLVPISVLLAQPPEFDPSQRVDEIWLHVTKGERVVDLGPLVQRSLVRLHGGVTDTEVMIPRELLRQRLRAQRTFGVVVGSVAVLSLLVGSVGVMNIMLASVIERTHEIGIRRTVGATRRDIKLQFLTESLFMTLSGGALGILSGICLSWGITVYAGWSTRVSFSAVMLAFVISFGVGLGFGIYPAVKASHLRPIDALRYE